MKSFRSTQNLCGRSVNYPHFGSLDTTNNINVQRGAIPPPGVDVLPSPCDGYYRSKNFNDANDDCKNCIYETQSFDRDCLCRLDENDISSWCNFAKCVSDEYKFKNRCKQSYYSLYNTDDIKDEYYMKPFTYEQLRFCNKQ